MRNPRPAVDGPDSRHRVPADTAHDAAAASPVVELDGLSVIALFVFAVALMDGVLYSIISEPLKVLGLTLLSFALSFGLALDCFLAAPAHQAVPEITKHRTSLVPQVAPMRPFASANSTSSTWPL